MSCNHTPGLSCIHTPGLSCIHIPRGQDIETNRGHWEKGNPGKALGYCRLHFVYNTPVEPQIGRQLCVIELCEEAGGRGSWGVQLADGLRLMKWIMRGARAGFHAKKRRKKTETDRLLLITCSRLAYWSLYPTKRPRVREGLAWASASFQVIHLGEFLL